MAKKPRRTGRPPQACQKGQGVPLQERLSAAVPWMLVGSVAVVLLLGVIYLPAALDGYPIRKVGVDGVTDVRRQQQIQTALAALVRDENYFSVPLEEIYQQAQGLSWVEGVSVRPPVARHRGVDRGRAAPGGGVERNRAGVG